MRLFAALLAITLHLGLPLAAEERIALIIGNGEYAAVTPLDNAVHDADLIAASLEALDFDVTLLGNATQIEMRRAVAQFGRRLREAGQDAVGLFYYAGHGVQSFGANYLVPVDAQLTVAADLDLVGMEASSVLRQMASARNRTNIVILDACRNNPFTDIPDMDDNGLAEMKAPTGTFLAYATAPGAVALDGTSGNSPFTRALASSMQDEGVPIEQVFKQVRNAVIEETGGAQTPWDTSSLTREFVFKPGRQLTPEEVAEDQLWQSVKQTRDAVQIMLFLRSYPDGRNSGEARSMLAEVMQKEIAPDREQAAAAPEPQPEPEQAAPPSRAPAASEAELMEAARASGRIEDYRAYLDAYPDGVFAELVKIEIASIEAKTSKDPEQAPPAPEPTETAVAPAPEPRVVFFDEPLTQGVPDIIGRTIIEVTELSPLFPPIEGLPEEMWKEQKCTSCHQWNREALCTQAKVYLTENASRALAKEHPFGGSFKRNLKAWAQGGCE
ncbi:MAG: caspase family protein [Pseudooceanicola sp.]